MSLLLPAIAHLARALPLPSSFFAVRGALFVNRELPESDLMVRHKNPCCGMQEERRGLRDMDFRKR